MKFKVGDRVAVYGSMLDQHQKCYYLRGNKGVIIDSHFAPDEYSFKADEDGWEYTVHPKQCRLLKKKVRRRLWLDPSSVERLMKAPKHSHSIEFIEVKEK